MFFSRKVRTSVYLILDALLVMTGAMLIVLAYWEVQHAPVMTARHSADVVFEATYPSLPNTKFKVDSVTGNLEDAFLDNVYIGKRSFEESEYGSGVLFYSPMARFIQHSSQKNENRDNAFQHFQSGETEPLKRKTKYDNNNVFAFYGPVYAISDCSDCAKLGVPDYKHGDLIGVHEVIYPVSNEFADLARKLLYALLVKIAVLALTGFILFPMIRKNESDRKVFAKRAESAEKQAVTDSLTRLPNRRYFEESLRGYLQEFGKLDQKVGLMILDLDHFKSVNDNFGHDAGDMVLREVAMRLSGVSRDHDVVARLGGEEFAIITPFVNENSLLDIAERYRKNIESLQIDVGAAILRPTVSIGVAVSRPEIDDQKLFQEADRKLYQAKNAGRNQVAA